MGSAVCMMCGRALGCEVCGRDVEGDHGRFCSRQCQVVAYNAKRRQQYRNHPSTGPRSVP